MVSCMPWRSITGACAVPVLTRCLRRCSVPGIEYQVKAASTNAPAECAYISIQCPAGQYQTDAPTRTADRECTDWATCKDTEYQIARGTAYHDVQCSKVSDKCSDDELENTPPTKFADRECIPKNCETVPNGLVPGPNGPEYCANGVSTGGECTVGAVLTYCTSTTSTSTTYSPTFLRLRSPRITSSITPRF